MTANTFNTPSAVIGPILRASEIQNFGKFSS